MKGAMGETRKLAAILAADIVGYSRLAGADEDRILARLRALRKDLMTSPGSEARLLSGGILRSPTRVSRST
jgi:class 3 adenylate cyclase